MVELLVVDDESHIREGISSGIPWESHGISLCRPAASAAEALAELERSLPDILILDIRMPDMDGLELLEITRKTYPSVRVVLISGHDDFEYAQRAISLGAFAYLLKPLDHAALLDTVLKAKAAIERQQAMVRKDEELRRAFRDNLPVLRNHFLVELAEGRIEGEKDVRQRAQDLSVDLKGTHSLAIAFLAARSSVRADPAGETDAGFLRFALQNRAEKLLRAVSPAAHCFSTGDLIGAVVRGSPPPRDAVISSCRELITWANSSMGLALAAGIGKTRHGFPGISASWLEAVDALQYRIIMGRNEVIDAEALGERPGQGAGSGAFERLLKRSDQEALAALRARDVPALERMSAEMAAELTASAAADIERSHRLVFLLASFLTQLAFSLDCDACVGPDGRGDLNVELARPRSQPELKGFLLDFFKRLLDCRAESDRRNNGHLVRLARQAVEEGISGDVSLSAVAQALHVNPSYLSRIFRQETSESFHAFATRARMTEAKRLLKTTTLRVHEIAERLRYRDLNHFAKVFRKAVGVSPTEFRDMV